MSFLRVELAPQQARRLQELVVPEPDGEIRLLTLVRAGRTVQAVRTDRGPLREFPADLHTGGLDRMRKIAGAPEVERRVTLEIEPDGPPGSVLEGLVRGSIRAEPPWVPALERIRQLPRWARAWAFRLLPAGAYGVAVSELGAAACVRISPAPTGRFAGLTAFALAATDRTPPRFLHRVRSRFGRPQLAVMGPESAIRAILGSPRPLTELERAEIRGEILIAAASFRVRLALLLLRILGA